MPHSPRQYNKSWQISEEGGPGITRGSRGRGRGQNPRGKKQRIFCQLLGRVAQSRQPQGGMERPDWEAAKEERVALNLICL